MSTNCIRPCLSFRHLDERADFLFSSQPSQERAITMVTATRIRMTDLSRQKNTKRESRNNGYTSPTPSARRSMNFAIRLGHSR